MTPIFRVPLFASLCVAVSAVALSSVALAGPECTKEPKSAWKDAKAFEQDLVKQGYKIKKFKTTSGHCYEIYGWNAQGQKVEIYFHPVTGAVVKEEVEK